MASTDARPVPQKNVAFRVTFPIYDADGDLVTGATGLDSEVSKDGGAFADVTAEATEIATSSGMYYLDLTSTEMNADTVAIIVKTTSVGAKTTALVLYPEEGGDIRVNVTQWSGSAPSALISGRVDSSIGAMQNNVLTAAAINADAFTAAKFAADVSAEIADAVWDEDATGHQTQGSFGQAIGDPAADTDSIWALVNTNLNATISSRASQTSVDTIDDFLDTEMAAVLAAVDTEVGAIKAKTDNLPADPADASDIAALIDALPTAAENATGLLDAADAIETGLTVRQALRAIAAVTAGELVIAAGEWSFNGAVSDVADRVVATVDGTGRTAIAYSL